VVVCLSSHEYSTLAERWGTRTHENLGVLCFQHHTGMVLKPSSTSSETSLYACPVPGCLILYDASRGYFVSSQAPNPEEQEIMPRVICPNDGSFMYLAQVLPEKRSFRLWKCPKCDARLTSEDSSQGLGKGA
jgi:hypothetical protein